MFTYWKIRWIIEFGARQEENNFSLNLCMISWYECRNVLNHFVEDQGFA